MYIIVSVMNITLMFNLNRLKTNKSKIKLEHFKINIYILYWANYSFKNLYANVNYYIYFSFKRQFYERSKKC